MPDGWSQHQLRELARVRRGASPRPIADPRWFATEGPGWVRIADVTAADGLLTSTTQRLSAEGVKRTVRVHPGQVIMSICATVGRPIIVGMDACIHDGFVVFDEHDGKIDPRFLVHHLRHMEPFFLSKGQTGTQANLNTGIVNASPIRLPPLAEQRQIAEILDTLDEAIRKTEAIIDKLKQVKQGLLHDLLTRGIDDNGELRDPERHPEQFKDSPLGRIPKEWTTVPLSELAIGGITNGVFKEPSRAGRGIPLINVGDLYRPFGIALKEVERFDADPAEIKRFRVHPGDVFFTRSSLNLAGIAHCNVVRDVQTECVFECHVMRVRPDASRVAPAFLSHWCRWSAARSFLMGRAKQVTMTTISQPDVSAVPVPVPKLREQKHIVDTLDQLAQRVAAETEHQSKLQQVKRALMEDLLTGRVRVTKLVEEAAA